MSAIGTSVVCQRVRAQVSLQLDGELSQLERRMLDAHLGRCAVCRGYAADLATFTNELRSAPLEVLAHPVIIRRPRRLALARMQAGVAAVIAIAAIGVATQVTESGPSDTTRSGFDGTVTQFPTRAEVDRELAMLEGLPNRTQPIAMGSMLL